APTPMMAQYRELKQRYPDFLLLFRLGDFYELFFEDAEAGAKLLSIALTSRQGAPMAGIPHHAAEAYIARLVQAGRKIAICEQMGVGGLTLGRQGAAGAIAYLRAPQGEALGQLTRLPRVDTGDALALDTTAVETLELVDSTDGRSQGSLFGVLNETVTPMGARLLRQWLLRPLLEPDAIAARQDAVAALVDAPAARTGLRALLRRVGAPRGLTARPALGPAAAPPLLAPRRGAASPPA